MKKTKTKIKGETKTFRSAEAKNVKMGCLIVSFYQLHHLAKVRKELQLTEVTDIETTMVFFDTAVNMGKCHTFAADIDLWMFCHFDTLHLDISPPVLFAP